MKKIFLLSILILLSACVPYMNKANLLVGNFYYDQGSAAKAMKYYEQYISKARAGGADLLRAKNNLLKIYISEAQKSTEQGDLGRAMELWNLVINGDFSQKAKEYAVLNLGDIYDEHGWLDKSEKLYTDAYSTFFDKRIKTRLLLVYILKADQLTKRGFLIDARRYYELALKLEPGSLEAQIGYDRIKRRGITIKDILAVYFDNPARLGFWEASELFDFFTKRLEYHLAKRLIPYLPKERQNFAKIKVEGAVFKVLRKKHLEDIVDVVKRDNTLWLATRNHGIFEYNTKTDRSRLFSINENFNNTLSIRGLMWYLDYLFIATLRHGVLVFDPAVGRLGAARLDNQSIVTTERHDGNIFIGTQNGMILKYNLRDEKIVSKIKLPKRFRNPVLDILIYKGKLYAGTFKGLYVIDLKTEKLSSTLLANTPVKALAVFNSGVAIGTWGHGVYFYSAERTLSKINSQAAYINKLKAFDDFLYVCTNRKGLWRYDKKYDYWYRFSRDDGLPDDAINNIYIDNNSLWVFGIGGARRTISPLRLPYSSK